MDTKPVDRPSVWNRPISRRTLLKGIAAATVVAGLTAAGCTTAAPSAEQPQSAPGETPKTPEGQGHITIISVGEALDKAAGNVSPFQTEPKASRLAIETSDGLTGALRETYNTFYTYADVVQRNDKLIVVDKPPRGKGLRVSMYGVLATNIGVAPGKEGKASQPGLHLQFQRIADTQDIAYHPDRLHPDADMVQGLYGITDATLNVVSPSYEKNQPYDPETNFDLLPVEPWAEVGIQGKNSPVITILGETDTQLILFVPFDGLQKSGLPTGAIGFEASESDVVFSKTD